MLFLPVAGVDTTPAIAGLPFEEHRIETADGERLHAWYVSRPGARYTILFFHGNAGNIGHRIVTLDQLHRLGLEVLIFDYRGYGRSSGRPGEQGTYADATAVWRYLVDHLGVAPQQILLHGRSLGGAIAIELATRTEPAGLILESTFTSVSDLGRHHYPWLPVRWLSRIDYDSMSRIERVNAPLLFIHSPDDEIVPLAHGRRLFDRAREPKTFLEIAGGHNTGFMDDAKTYLSGLAAFIDGLR
jgi:hypothetical protein